MDHLDDGLDWDWIGIGLDYMVLDWDCHLHVPDVVDVQGLLQADHQALRGLKIA